MNNDDLGVRLTLLLRDGTIYFLVMFATSCSVTFTWLFASRSLIKVAIAPMIAVSSVSVRLRLIFSNPPTLKLTISLRVVESSSISALYTPPEVESGTYPTSTSTRSALET